jgi:hypothetical protein
MQAPQDDLFYLPQDHPDWKLLLSKFSLVEFENDEKVVASYKKFYQHVALGNAFVSKSYVHESKAKKYLYVSMYASYYYFFKGHRLEQNEYFCANPDLEIARGIWNLLENKVAKGLLGVVLPKIKVNNKIYVPMLDNPELFTKKDIGQLPAFDLESR